MEDNLEKKRLSSLFNWGESGLSHKTVRDIFELSVTSGTSLAQLHETLLNTPLCDSPNHGSGALREQVAALYPFTQADQVLVTTGTSEALYLLFCYLKPKKTAVIWPAFQLLYEIPQSLGSEVIPLHVHWDDAGMLEPKAPLDAWLQTLTQEKPDVVVINHPHNPTGLVLTQEDLRAISQGCAAIGARLIADEHYRFLCAHGQPSGYALGPTLRNNTTLEHYVTGSFIKCFGVTGLRVGWCIGPQKALSHMQNHKNYLTHTVNPISEFLSTLLLTRNPDEFPFLNRIHKHSWNQWHTNSVTLKNLKPHLMSLGVVAHEPQGGLVTLLCCDTTQWKHPTKRRDFARDLDQLGIFMLPFEDFEPTRFSHSPSQQLHDRFMVFRLGLGSPCDNFSRGLAALIDLVKSYR